MYSYRYYGYIKILKLSFYISLLILSILFLCLSFKKIANFVNFIIYKKNISLGSVIVLLITLFQLVIVINPLKINKLFVLNKFSYSLHHAGLKNTTFKNYFLKETFNEIKSSIGPNYPDKNFATIGFSPSIAIYNNLKTVNFYWAIYPIDNLRKIYLIIRKEISRSDKYNNFEFKKGKKRNYLYSTEINTQYFHEENSAIPYISPLYDSNSIKKANIDYFLSATKIKNNKELGLRYKEKFINDRKKIYLYEVVY